MLRCTASLIASILLGLVFVVLPLGASASADGICPGGYRVTVKNPKTGQTEIKVICPGSPGTQTGGGENSGVIKCMHGGKEIDCKGPDGTAWSAANQCWIKLKDPQPAPPAGTKDADGNWYDCIAPDGLIPEGGWTGSWPVRWIEGAPATVDPRVLAAQAVAAMDLEPIRIGIVPESGPDKVGLVGLPVWLWVKDPAPNTYGPITKSASDQGVTVTATAKVAKVVWDMGDGTTITCAAGTPYEDRFGKQASPSCGHRYLKMSDDQPGGAYTVTATSIWEVEWSGGGMSGTVSLDLTNDTETRIGELQVLTQ